MVVWIIGLSGAGKTTLAERVVKEIRGRGRKVVLLDGDRVRELFGNDLGHSIAHRLKNADRICELSRFLEREDIDVVCSILSIFPESREWCRRELNDYYEVFIDTPKENLIARDSKGLYSKYMRGEIKDVAGFDLDFILPDSPDLRIENNGSLECLLDFAPIIVERVCG